MEKQKIKGFTLVELLVVIAIIALLVVIVFASIEQSRKNARINSAKTSMKSALPAIVACRDNGGAITTPSADTDICNPASAGIQNAKWPRLDHGYTYGSYNVGNCELTLNTNSDVTNLGNTYMTCSCLTQLCQ